MDVTVILIPAEWNRPIERLVLKDPDIRTFEQLLSGSLEVIDCDAVNIASCETAELEDRPLNGRATGLLYLTRPDLADERYLSGACIIAGKPEGSGRIQSAPDLYIRFLVGDD